MSVHFSSATAEWATPAAFFEKLVLRFGPFDLDPCASVENAKADLFYTRADDGLKQDWSGRRVFMNPPYGRSIGKWMQKAYESSIEGGAVVVCLVPARTDTAWWHNYAAKGDVEFIRGRLQFGDRRKDAPFASALVVFSPSWRIAERRRAA
jgi:phage N-6-adenine-methyltransferase